MNQNKTVWSWQHVTLLLNPKDQKERLLSALKLLNSDVVCAIVVDGSGFTLTATRRLQLAAQKHGALCFLLRPPWEEKNLSAAQTRWKVKATGEGNSQQQAPLSSWALEIFQAKGAPSPKSWEVIWSVYDQAPSFSLVNQRASGSNRESDPSSATSSLRNLASRVG